MLLQLLGSLILLNSGCSIAFYDSNLVPLSKLRIYIIAEVFVGVLLILIGTLKGLLGDAEPDVILKDGKWIIDEPNGFRSKLAMKLGHPLREIDLDVANSSMNFYEFLEHGGRRPPLTELAAKYRKYKESL